MSQGGERKGKGLWTAAALALLVGGTFAPLVAPPSATAQSGSDPWWGPSDRSSPLEGWAVRIPVVVENPYEYNLRDHPATVDLDFGKLLVQAGWTNQTKQARTVLRGFALDLDSLRVVEYGTGFSPGPKNGATTEPTPHVFHTSPFGASRFLPFDATTNPSGTLMFVLDGVTRPHEKRFFYVYANPVEYSGGSEPFPFKLEKRAPLDAYLSGNALGTVFYGYEPRQSGLQHKLFIAAGTAEKTTVSVYTYGLGKFSLVAPTGQYPNPFTLTSTPGGDAREFFVPAGTAFKVVANHPILVAGHGPLDQNEASPNLVGYVPSVTGSFAGERFYFYSFDQTAGARTPVTLTLSGTETAVVVDASGTKVAELTPGEPIQTISVASSSWVFLRATSGRFLVSYAPPYFAGPQPTIPVPALTGGPAGRDFYGGIPADGGFFVLCSMTPASVRVIDNDQLNVQVYPEGPTERTAAKELLPAPGCDTREATPITPRNEMLFTSVADSSKGRARELVRVFTGAENRNDPTAERSTIGHFGGLFGVDHHVTGRIGIFGHFNDTRVNITVERGDGSVASLPVFSVRQDDFVGLDPSVDPRFPRDMKEFYRVVSSKPVTLVSIEEFDHPHARQVPGRQPPVTTVVGEAQFRGPLVEIRSPDKEGRSDFRSTAPQTPVTFRLEVLNLGRWIGNSPLPDTITLTCRSPAGWLVEGCERALTLGSGVAERVEVVVTPPADALEQRRGEVIVEARSAAGGPAATFSLGIAVEIRYGVKLFFDAVDGRKTIEPAENVDPGGTETYTIVLLNTGSAEDSFDLRVTEPAPGWTQRLLLDGSPVTRVERVPPGQTRTLTFVVTAPNQETAPQNLVSISAKSVANALAGDVVNTATRIRPKVNIDLELDPTTRVAEPNETAVFNITVNNSGNDIFRIAFVRDGSLLEGWTANFTIDPPEVDLSPNVEFTFGLHVTPPPGARAGELATIKITAETDAGGGETIPSDEIAAVVVVRRIHNVTTPPLLDARARPGDAFDYVLPIVNGGNGNDALEFLPGAVSPPGWRVAGENQSVHLAYNQTTDVPLTVEVPPGTPPGLYNLTFTARLSREATQNLSIPVEVVPFADVSFEGRFDLHAVPGRAHRIAAEAVNTGNLPGLFTFTADAPPSWSVAFEPASAELAPGERVPVTIVLNSSRESADGRFDVALSARLGETPAGATPAAVTLARPDLHIVDVAGAGAVRAGELVTVTATLENRGDIAAENVSVALVVDGVAVHRVVLSRVAVDQRALATLNWVATERGSDVRVVVDPEQEIVMKTPDAKVASVTFGGRLGTPGFAPVMAVAVGAFLALALRRRDDA